MPICWFIAFFVWSSVGLVAKDHVSIEQRFFLKG